MNKWDKSEDKEDLRYSIIMQNDGTIKIVDLFTGKMDWVNVEMLGLGGSGKASDYKSGFLNKMSSLDKQEKELTRQLKDLKDKLPADNFTSFFNRNFSWKEICESEIGIKYVS